MKTNSFRFILPLAIALAFALLLGRVYSGAATWDESFFLIGAGQSHA
jgi:hypothetical protein